MYLSVVWECLALNRTIVLAHHTDRLISTTCGHNAAQCRTHVVCWVHTDWLSPAQQPDTEIVHVDIWLFGTCADVSASHHFSGLFRIVETLQVQAGTAFVVVFVENRDLPLPLFYCCLYFAFAEVVLNKRVVIRIILLASSPTPCALDGTTACLDSTKETLDVALTELPSYHKLDNCELVVLQSDSSILPAWEDHSAIDPEYFRYS